MNDPVSHGEGGIRMLIGPTATACLVQAKFVQSAAPCDLVPVVIGLPQVVERALS